MSDTTKLLTYREAGDLLQVSDRTVWTLVRKGLLIACRIGRQVRIEMGELQAFVQRSKNPKKISEPA